MSPALVSLDQLNEMLADRLEELLPELIGGQAVRGEWSAARREAGGIGDSLKVAMRGAKRGKWNHHAAGGIGGDPLGLIAYARFNNDMKRAFAWARDFLGGKIEPETEKDRELRRQRLANLRRKEERETRTHIGRARYTFFKLGQELVAQDGERSPAWHYLNNRLAGRFEQLGHIPGCLKFIPALDNYQLGRPLPALGAGVVNAQGDQVALHQTWLVKRGAGDDTWDRLREDDASRTVDGETLKGKKFMGPAKSCSIRLWPGVRVHGETGEVKRGVGWPKLGPGSSIMLAEGIETALSLVLAMPERRIVCTGSIEGFVNIELPPCFGKVIIAADRDPDNKAAAGALERAKLAHAQAGRHCSVVYPPEGIDDWNTALKQAAARVA